MQEQKKKENEEEETYPVNDKTVKWTPKFS